MTTADPNPPVRASDADREATVARLQTALAEGRLNVDEFVQRVDVVQGAGTLGELDTVLGDLPGPEVEMVGQRTGTAPIVQVFGDVKVAVTSDVPQRTRAVFGNVRFDLRGLRTADDVVDVWISTVFGDVDVIVSEGVAAELHGRTILGNRKIELAAVPRITGTPRVVVHASVVLGNLTLRSLTPGTSPSRWRAVLDRLARRIVPPPLP